MQGLKSTHISPAEWRWVFVISGALTALTLLPYAWALAANATAVDWQFMGILANPQDGAAYLAKIGQGIRGAWLLHLVHTPEPHAGAAIQVFYLLLGHLARIINVSNIVIFHLARVVTTLFMFSALYQFGATVWSRLRPRRLFFALVAVGSGLGWLALILGADASTVPDMTVAEAYPLYSAYANPHFPLAIGCLALLAAAYIRVFRIDFNEEPSVANGGLEVVVLTLVMALVLPQALIPFGGALVVYLVVCALKSRGIPVLELRWIAMVVLPTVLMAAYYGVVLWSNDKMRDVWLGQVDAPSAHPVLIVLGYGLLLFTAIPGLVRALRRFEQDGDQLMLIWLVVNFVVVFIPFNQQRRLMTGLIIPVAFFAVRSLEDYWLSLIKSDRLRYSAMLALFVFIMPSNVLALGFPLFGLVNPEAGIELRLMVERGYWEAMGWLSQNGKPDDVVLSSPNVGLWIPAWAGKRVVYGHPWETLDAATKLAQVERWYQGQDCDGLLSRYGVRYVLVGPQERAIGAGNVRGDACYASLEESASRVVDFTDVTLYELGN